MSDEREPADLDDVRQRLDALEDKLQARRPEEPPSGRRKEDKSQYAMAFRVSSDFIAAIFVGGLLGWFLDSFAGTSPFGLIVLLLLGFAAGVLNVMRTLGLVAEPRRFRPGKKDASTGNHPVTQDDKMNDRERR
ncbi:MAG: AtpZ/AtpI family protein [Pseudomonadota bacterium]